MLTYFQSVLLSFVQSATELLPISSSGHLIIFSDILNIKIDYVLIELLHFPTLLAIIFAFRERIFQVFKLPRPEFIKFGTKVIITSIPAAALGVLLSDYLDKVFYNLPFVAFNLIFWGILMIILEKNENKFVNTLEIEKIGFKQAILIGLGQMLALFPGTSRSGITTMSGMLTGIRKDLALEYAFLVGIPIISGSFLYTLIKDGDRVNELITPELITGLVLALLFSIFFGWLLNRFKKERFLTFFGWYRIVIGALILICIS